MAMTVGILAFTVARTLRRRVTDEWFFGSAGAASVGFALAFLALANHWIQLERRPFHHSVFLWFCFYFGFSAICMLALALRLHKLGPSQAIQWNASTPLVNPKHAH
jgi:high-affinity Fe2+/Pb2+ permease